MPARMNRMHTCCQRSTDRHSTRQLKSIVLSPKDLLEQVCATRLSSAVNSDRYAREIAKLWYPLPYGTAWVEDLGRHTDNQWKTQFLSSKALITRGELVKLLYHKLWDDVRESTQRPPYRAMCKRLTRDLTWEFYGSLSIAYEDDNTRKFVGFDPHFTTRRDFVQISTPANTSSTTHNACTVSPKSGKVRFYFVTCICSINTHVWHFLQIDVFHYIFVQ